jgi:hypothetical protein
VRIRVAALLVLVGCGRLQYDLASAVDAGVDGGARPLLTYRDAVLADRPIGYWRLGDVGTVARDEMGRTDGTYVGDCRHGATGALTGDLDTALELDGACYVTVGGGFDFPGNAAYSIELWLSTAAESFVLMRETRSTDTPTAPLDGYAIVADVAEIYAERAIDGDNQLGGRVPLPARFVHVVYTYDGAAMRLYTDGVLGATSPDARPARAVAAACEIGGLATGEGAVHGLLDEVAIYDHALTLDRIAEHHDLGVDGPR